MGIGPTALTLYCDLARRGLLKPKQRMLELGSQKLYLEKWQWMMSTFADALDKKLPMDVDFVSSRDLMEALGFVYTSIDPDGMYGAEKLDLNVHQHFESAYDIVTNHGDSEHIFNQAAFFHSMHDATKVGGLMIHVVPMRGYDGHCFYLYKPELFEMMAQANNYSVIGIWVAEDEAVALHPPIAVHTLAGYVLLCAVFRKMVESEFVMPNQLAYQKFFNAS